MTERVMRAWEGFAGEGTPATPTPVLGLWSISVAWTEESLYDLQLLAAAPDWNDLLAAAATTPVNRRSFTVGSSCGFCGVSSLRPLLFCA